MPKKRFELIKFKASLPNIQSAIQTHGGGDGFLVKLDVPQTESLAVMQLGVCTGRVFEITVKVALDGDEEGVQGNRKFIQAEEKAAEEGKFIG